MPDAFHFTKNIDGIEKHLAGRRREREIKDLSSIMVNRFMLDIDIKKIHVSVTKANIAKGTTDPRVEFILPK